MTMRERASGGDERERERDESERRELKDGER